jgi:hypothetical protein
MYHPTGHLLAAHRRMVVSRGEGPDEQRRRFDAMFATIFGLTSAWRMNASGMPSPLQTTTRALLMEYAGRAARAGAAHKKAPLSRAFSSVAGARLVPLRDITHEYTLVA